MARIIIGALFMILLGSALVWKNGIGNHAAAYVLFSQPNGACSGSAPLVAQRAGFTTMALCNDFAQAIPNTAGTGLPSNTSGNCYGGAGCWLGCAIGTSFGDTDNNKHVWYQATAFGFAPPCNESGGGIQQVTDPTYGNLTLDIAYTASDQNTWSLNTLEMVGPGLVNNWSPSSSLFLDFPMGAYFQIVARDNLEGLKAIDGTDVFPNTPNDDHFLWDACTFSGTCSHHVLESDIFEFWGLQQAPNGALHSPGGGGGPFTWLGYNNLAPGFTMNQYHKFGLLLTSDGSSNIAGCAYIDDTLVTYAPNGKPCPQPSDNGGAAYAAIGSTTDNDGSVAQRNTYTNWVGSYAMLSRSGPQGQCPNGSNVYQNWCVDLRAGAMHRWVKSFQVWSCADWKRGSSGPNPNCFGGPALTNGTDGSQFYKVTTQ